MIEKFWEKMSEELAGEWNARLLTPALAFWGATAVLILYRFDAWKSLRLFLKSKSLLLGGAALVGLLFVLVVSTAVVQWLTLPVLRLLEGYLPRFLGRLRLKGVERLNLALVEKENEYGRLGDLLEAGRTDSLQAERYALLEAELANYPQDANLRLPTRLGNTLRAAEEYPYERYGLEITVTWPRLWLLLSESTRQELLAARQSLDAAVQMSIWGLAFLLSAFLAWGASRPASALLLVGAILPGLGVLLAAWLRAHSAAEIYAVLLRSAYDLYRFNLYEALRWKPPLRPEAEKDSGIALTHYLQRARAPALAKFIVK